jgi:hypothetical protein
VTRSLWDRAACVTVTTPRGTLRPPLRETSRHLGGVLGGVLSFAVAVVILAGCGGDDDGGQFADEPAGDYPVEIVSAEFPARQKVAETYDMELAIRNTGDETIPGITTSISLPGMGSTLAFAYRDPQEGLAMPQRPVWVMEEGYPKLAGTEGRGGAADANRRTFNFGELPPGETADIIWRVTAVRPGSYEVAYRIAAGVSGEANAVDADGEDPTGVLPVRVNSRPVVTKIDENGKVVPLSPSERFRLKMQERDSG